MTAQTEKPPTEGKNELDNLDDQIEKLKEEKRRLKDLIYQRENYLPRLKKHKAVLTSKIAPLGRELEAVDKAIRKIESGELTDYRLRKPRPRKPKGTEQKAK